MIVFIPGGIISKFISSYDAVNYEPLLSRKTRSVGEYAVPLNIRFDALNRSFDLMLTPVDRFTTVFDQDVQIDVDGSTIHLSPSNFLYRGYDKSKRARISVHLIAWSTPGVNEVHLGDEDSFIYGSLINGVFSGHIRYRTGESFTVESAKLYFTNESSSHFHSVIYPDTAIKFFNISRRKRSSGREFPGCGLTGERLQRMLRFQKRHASTSTEEKEDMIDKTRSSCTTAVQGFEDLGAKSSCYGGAARGHQTSLLGSEDIAIAVAQFEFRPCGKTVKEITAIVQNHVQTVNEVYGSTDFNGITGVKFVIKRLTIFSMASCGGQTTEQEKNPFCSENLDIEAFLHLNSQGNHFDYCLVYALTYRDFADGATGLAWTAGSMKHLYTLFP
ncbi:unnamed protein product [Toxocara canis]|uniref:Uncharacterized protein n=1 Tax=Toxocara canis TaxID=6265 RepID=A0A3P7IC74_TOXCA|nr:unnamed protein product [Toxocara canis]